MVSTTLFRHARAKEKLATYFAWRRHSLGRDRRGYFGAQAFKVKLSPLQKTLSKQSVILAKRCEEFFFLRAADPSAVENLLPFTENGKSGGGFSRGTAILPFLRGDSPLQLRAFLGLGRSFDSDSVERLGQTRLSARLQG